MQNQPKMKKIATLMLMLITITASAQIKTNHPELVNPVIDYWIEQAEQRGFDIAPLATIDSITMVPFNDLAGGDYFQGKIRVNPIHARDTDGTIDQWKLTWIVFHEISHHIGVRDCYSCKYNITAGNLSERAVYLFQDEFIRPWMLDNYFEQLKNPNAKHDHR